MNRLQAFVQVIISIVLIVGALFLEFQVHWTVSFWRILMLLVLYMFGYGIINLSIAITRLIMPQTADFNLAILRNKHRLQFLTEEIGKGKVTLITVTVAVLMLALGIGIGYKYLRFTQEFEKTQLSQFGLRQRVQIIETSYTAKMRQASFNYILQGKTFFKQLPSSTYNQGDSVTIIFSTQNPEIVDWVSE